MIDCLLWSGQVTKCSIFPRTNSFLGNETLIIKMGIVLDRPGGVAVVTGLLGPF